jgi:hypothetical protein
MYILTYKIYLEEKLYKIIVFVWNGRMINTTISIRSTSWSRIWESWLCCVSKIWLDQTMRFKNMTWSNYVILPYLFITVLLYQNFMFVVLILQKKKKSPQSTHLKSFLLSHKGNFTVVITQERNAQDNVLRF